MSDQDILYAEITLLGSVINFPECYMQVMEEGITEASFSDPRHLLIWRLITERVMSNRDFDSVSISMDVIGNYPNFKSSYVGEIASTIETGSSCIEAARCIVSHRNRSSVIHLSSMLCHELRDGNITADEFLFKIEAMIVSQQKLASDDSVTEVVRDLLTKKEDSVIFKSGIATLDDRFVVAAGDFTCIAARSSMGKSSLYLSYCDTAIRADHGVCIISLEMSRSDVMRRWAAMRAGIDIKRINDGIASASDISALKKDIYQIEKSGGSIFVRSKSINISELRVYVKGIKLKNPKLGILVVDYIQLMTETTGSGNRESKVAEMSRGLKGIAMDFGITVIGLSQLNDNNLQENPFPTQSNMRESKAIYQDSDNVLFLVPTNKGEDGNYKAGGKMWFSISKQREGDAGFLVPTNFRKQCTRFEPYEEGDEDLYSGPISMWQSAKKWQIPRNNIVDISADESLF